MPNEHGGWHGEQASLSSLLEAPHFSGGFGRVSHVPVERSFLSDIERIGNAKNYAVVCIILL